MVSAVALIKNKTGKQTRPRRSSVIDGERNAEAEKERSARSCQGSGSRSVPGRARGAQPTRSPRGSGAPAKPVPRQPRVWPPPGTPGPAVGPPPAQGLTRDVSGSCRRGPGKARCNRVERGSGPALEALRQAICLGLSSPGSWGIRGMGCCVLSLMLMCRPAQLLGRQKKLREPSATKSRRRRAWVNRSS